MKPVFFDVKSLLKNSIFVKEIKSENLNDQFHFHNAYEIALIIEGNGRRIVGDNVDSFSHDDLIIIGPNVAHASYSDKKYNIVESNTRIHAIVVYFMPDWISEYHMSSLGFTSLRKLLNHLTRGIKVEGRTLGVIKSLLLELLKADEFKSLVILLQILYEISTSRDYKFLASARYTALCDEADISRIDIVYKYAMENFKESISLAEVSRLINMTPNSFCKYFKNKTSKTFVNFVNEIRINYACELLLNSDLDISQICYQCGFNNFASFNKCFKLFTKVTPSFYRKRVIMSIH